MTKQLEFLTPRTRGNTIIEETTRLAQGQNTQPASSPAAPGSAPATFYDPADSHEFTATPLRYADQTTKILGHLLSGKSITPLEALNLYGCFRLGARVWDLKKDGYNVKTEMVKINGKRVARYWMVK